MNRVWFGESDPEIYDFSMLSSKIVEMFYNIEWDNIDLNEIPAVFKRQICSPLLVSKTMITKMLKLEKEPTWIVCIDEAEFLNEELLKCINNIFRSDSNRIALKVATLPYYHRTLNTLVPNVTVADGNDFSFRVVDLNYENVDFIALTNKLCKHRLQQRFNCQLNCPDLETFLGLIGNDDQIDYYRAEVGEENSQRKVIEDKIISGCSPKRRENAKNYSNKRKTIYDKYAPILFMREMYELSKTGNHKPGWFAGAKNVRKLSQGNPRIYIQIMNDLFEKARKTPLSPKVQHEVIMKFSKRFCDETQALEKKGPVIYKELKKISSYLQDKVHSGYLKTTGISFFLKYSEETEFKKSREWLELAIAYSRITVDDEIKICGIKHDTKFMLSNIYAMAYWLPIRSDSPENIVLSHMETNAYVVKAMKKTKPEWTQLSLFDEVQND